jgi:hypothetical protein
MLDELGGIPLVGNPPYHLIHILVLVKTHIFQVGVKTLPFCSRQNSALYWWRMQPSVETNWCSSSWSKSYCLNPFNAQPVDPNACASGGVPWGPWIAIVTNHPFQDFSCWTQVRTHLLQTQSHQRESCIHDIESIRQTNSTALAFCMCLIHPNLWGLKMDP